MQQSTTFDTTTRYCQELGIVSDCGLHDRAIGVRFPVGAKDLPLTSVSTPALSPPPPQPPVQWVPGVLSLGQSAAGGMTLTTHSHLVPRLRMRSYTSPHPKRPHGVKRDCFAFYTLLPIPFSVTRSGSV
jgi:hypothetical protein